MITGQEFKEARLQQGVAAKDIARVSGYNGSTLSNWETGKNPPSEKATAQFIAALEKFKSGDARRSSARIVTSKRHNQKRAQITTAAIKQRYTTALVECLNTYQKLTEDERVLFQLAIGK